MNPLSHEQLRYTIDPNQFEFETTASLEASTQIIGQPRGTRAIEFGVGIQSEGYNIFVLGETGTGRATAIKRFLQAHAAKGQTPDDWIYVNNFSVPHEPRAIEMRPGEAVKFKEQMAQLVESIQRDLPAAFATEAYQEAVTAVQQEFETFQNQQLAHVNATAREQNFALIQTAQGYALAPLVDGKPITQEQAAQISPEDRQKLEEVQRGLNEVLQTAMEAIYKANQEVRDKLVGIDREVADGAILHYFDTLRTQYEEEEELLLYLSEVHDDLLTQLTTMVPAEGGQQPQVDLRRYAVNVLVDNQNVNGAPVILETNPTFHQLFGRIEYELVGGGLTTHFSLIQPGTVHHANGGYLILMASDLLRDARAWEELKRVVRHGELRVPIATQGENGPVIANSISPEPIPFSLKIILMGSPGLYYLLHEQDRDFGDLFKVRADFAIEMARNDETEMSYAQFIATRCHKEALRHFDKTAVSKVIEYGIRLANHQKKLSTRFGAITDLLREANYWAGTFEREIVSAEDVQQALHERIYRANWTEERIHQNMIDNTIFVATDGEEVGQVNGLSVLDNGEYAFGQPGRITASVYMGDSGIVHIERETEMSGPLHQKGVLTLTGYLGGRYAADQPLSLSASLTFEQNYGGVDGDSASSTELYALLSSLSGVPIKQGIAVTGSVNQKGEVQPIGGANEKIEGFFRVCQARGLTGEQGVMIPKSNVINLMLHEDVITAVKSKQFHIYSIATIDEGIEQLTGVAAGKRDAEGNYPEGSIHYKVQARLRQMAEDLSSFGEDGENEEEN
ncbi:MAG: AAA family ATPase [Chloroflexota bacterium]